MLVELGVGAQGGQRVAQFVAGVGEEAPGGLLAGLALVDGGLDAVSIPLRAVPRRPTSVARSCGLTRSVRSPAVIRSAWAAIVSMGRRPRRMTQATPRKTSRPAAREPMVRMSSSRPTVLLTWPRLVLATRVRPRAGMASRRSWACPLRLITVWVCWPAAGTDTSAQRGNLGTKSGLPASSALGPWPDTNVTPYWSRTAGSHLGGGTAITDLFWNDGLPGLSGNGLPGGGRCSGRYRLTTLCSWESVRVTR